MNQPAKDDESLGDPAERAIQCRKVTRAQRLNSSRVSSIERSHIIRATGSCRSRSRAKPQSNVVGVNRSCCRIGVHIRERRVGEDDRSRSGSGSHDERLDAEAANEIGDSDTIVVGRQVTLVPGESERRIGYLDQESIELRLWRESGCFHVHDFDVAKRVDGHPPLCAENASRGYCRRGGNHAEGCALRQRTDAHKAEYEANC